MSVPFTAVIHPLVGDAAACAARYHALQQRIPEVQQRLRGWHDGGSLPMLTLPARTDDLTVMLAVADTIRQTAKGLMVFGTGGSSLGGQTLCALAEEQAFPVRFIDNLDPETLEQFCVRADLTDWHVLAISKSGSTVETVTQLLVWLQAMKARGAAALIGACAHIITVPDDSPMRQLAVQHGIPVLDHDPKVGGRYSVLSLVGLLPAAVAGVDVIALRQGAQAVWQQVAQAPLPDALLGACWQTALMEHYSTAVLMPYADRLRLFGAWYKQLWAESIGKSGKGSTPAPAVGAVDQHSQLQLFLDGPQDKSFTFITLPHANQGAALQVAALPSLAYLQGFKTGDVMASLQHGTIETLLKHQMPVRELALTTLDAYTLGALLMHWMIETIATAQLMEVDAFDQPAVEESKQRARDYLARRAREAMA